ncbi:Na+/galactose cotransporter, partial [bacterium]|nr:Na+/galactose cotransporter [bacterium]
LAVKFNWISASVLTLSREASDMSANFWRAWWAWLICLVVTVAVSLITKPKPREELMGLVKGLTTIEKEKNLPFYKKPEVMALLAILLFVLLNVYFW